MLFLGKVGHLGLFPHYELNPSVSPLRVSRRTVSLLSQYAFANILLELCVVFRAGFIYIVDASRTLYNFHYLLAIDRKSTRLNSSHWE